MVTLRLPRVLADVANVQVSQDVGGESVSEALDSLFEREPGLRNHILDNSGAIRPHVSVFVDGSQADLAGPLGESSEIRILHAVSGG